MTQVYANGNEIASQSGDGKVVAAFPDVCMSPPPPPAGPVPVPYPNSSFSRDMKNGSKSVTIGGKPVMLRDQSYYQSSPLGNEAATRNFGASVVTHTISGKTYFAAWSMDVQFEGKNVPRHVDLATSNHGSYPGSTPPYANLSKMQRVALQRAKDKQCPCCGKSQCVSAFRDGDEPISFEEFYELNGQDAKSQRRRDVFATIKAMKERECTCEGRVFPEPPCDVFRKRDSDRSKRIETAWGSQVESKEGARRNVKEVFQREFFRKNKGVMERFVVANPREKPPKMTGGFKQTNHLTPKVAVGCPDNPGNLQPHDLLCSVCKAIDDQFTEWQGNKSDSWDEFFRKSGAKRRRLAQFSPPSWRRLR